MTIRKTTFGRWEVIGAPAEYGSSDSNQSPTVPPTFTTRRAALAFIVRTYAQYDAARSAK